MSLRSSARADGAREVTRTRVALLGSTGSIGRQAVEVLERLRDRFEVVALATGSDRDEVTAQARRLDVRTVAVGPTDGALVELAERDDVDLVVVGTGGVVSLRPVLAALHAGKGVATANKEALGMAGHPGMAEAPPPPPQGAPARPP